MQLLKLDRRTRMLYLSVNISMIRTSFSLCYVDYGNIITCVYVCPETKIEIKSSSATCQPCSQNNVSANQVADSWACYKAGTWSCVTRPDVETTCRNVPGARKIVCTYSNTQYPVVVVGEGISHKIVTRHTVP